MTKKDYVIIAEALALTVSRANKTIRDKRDFRVAHAVLSDVVDDVAQALQRDNPRFDKERFRAYVKRCVSW
jgi:hypothetical protein